MPHKRNITPMISSLRCGAKTRRGTPCQSPAVSEKKRCRMHGGAEGSGAPKGNKNALKTGFYTKEAIEERKLLNEMMKDYKKTLKELDEKSA